MGAHKTPEINEAELRLNEPATKIMKIGLIVGVVGLALSFVIGNNNAHGDNPDHWAGFQYSYLVAFSYWLSICLGSLFFVTIQHLVKAGWSVVVRRLAEFIASAVPVMFILFLPILIPTLMGSHALYHWTDPALLDPTDSHYDKLMVINPGGGDVGLPGDIAQEPVFGLPALWIDRELRDEAGLRDLTVVDCGTIVTTHLAELVKDNIADLLSYTETQKLLNEVHRDAEKLVADLVPAKISISGIQRILQNLLAEGVSVRDMTTILEAIAETAPLTQNLTQITEHVRARLARQISAQQTRDGSIPILTLSPDWDQQFAESIIGDGDERHLAMAPSNLQRFITQVRELYDTLAANNEIPCILVSPSIRPFVRSIIERVRPATVVLSQNEIHPRTRVRSVGSIGQQTSLEAP